MKLRKLIIALGLGACMLMTGCGGAETSTASGSADTSTASSDGSDIQKIKDNGVLKVGVKVMQ